MKPRHLCIIDSPDWAEGFEVHAVCLVTDASGYSCAESCDTDEGGVFVDRAVESLNIQCKGATHEVVQ